MANIRAIQTKIKSVKNIKKITWALEVVSTVKLQKLKKQTEKFKDYMEEFLKILNVAKDKLDIFDTPKNQDGKRLLIVNTSEKGLCGSINSKLLKHIYTKYEDGKDNVDIFCVGKKWVEFFARTGFNVIWSVNVNDNFEEKDLNILYSFLKKAFVEKEYAKIKVYFNYFKNTINQIPIRFKIFPIDKDSFDKFVENTWVELTSIKTPSNKDMIVEPDLKEFKIHIIRQLVSHILYGAVLQNKAGEHASRMIAMKNAKDNSNDLITSLEVMYNKQRQSAVTQEISEIVWAKAAME